MSAMFIVMARSSAAAGTTRSSIVSYGIVFKWFATIAHAVPRFTEPVLLGLTCFRESLAALTAVRPYG